MLSHFFFNKDWKHNGILHYLRLKGGSITEKRMLQFFSREIFFLQTYIPEEWKVERDGGKLREADIAKIKSQQFST